MQLNRRQLPGMFRYPGSDREGGGTDLAPAVASPPEIMILNEPEASLHPSLLDALARLLIEASHRSQIVLVFSVRSNPGRAGTAAKVDLARVKMLG